MIGTWYAIVSFMLITYVVLDGRNFARACSTGSWQKRPPSGGKSLRQSGRSGRGTKCGCSALVARCLPFFPPCWRRLLRAITWRVFLILWCLILRGISIEFGGHINDLLWQGFWDFVFVVSSLLLAVLFGAAGGNVARGVPLDDHGNFAMAFFTHFGVRGNVGLLDWYTVSVAVLAVVMLAAHGAVYLTLKTVGPVHDRSASFARILWPMLLPLGAVVSLETWYVRPDIVRSAAGKPLVSLGVFVVACSALALATGIRKGLERRAFVGSTFLIAGLLGTGGAAIFPVMLHSTSRAENSITAYGAASSPDTLLAALAWWPIAFILAASYFVFISRRYAGKVSTTRDNQGYY